MDKSTFAMICVFLFAFACGVAVIGLLLAIGETAYDFVRSVLS